MSVANGNLTLNGTGGTTSGATNYGVDLSGGTVQTTGTGAISITGVGNGSGDIEHGIFHNNTLVQSTAVGGGGITWNGTSNATGGVSNDGVYFNNTGSTVTSVDGNISITGQGATAASGNGNNGIYMSLGQTIQSTGNATITLDGTGGLWIGGIKWQYWCRYRWHCHQHHRRDQCNRHCWYQRVQ